MKFFKNAIILFVVLIIAFLSYWYFDVKKSKEKKEIKNKEALIFEETDKKIVQLTLKEKDKNPIVIKVKDEKQKEEEWEWEIISPIKTNGDKYTIKSILDNIKNSKKEEVVQENLSKEEEYGLNDPYFSLRFLYEKEEAERGIDFGIESLDKKKVFVKVLGKEKIYSFSVSVRDSIKKSLFDVRDKRVCTCEKDDIDGISLMTSQDVIVLKKDEDGNWFFLPDKLKASKSRVDMYTGNLRWGNFSEVIEEKGERFEKYGLNNPNLILSFNLKDKSNFMFIVGNSVKEDNVEYFYATRSTDKVIFQVPSNLVYKLVTTRFELKDRHIFDFTEDDVDAVTLEHNGKKLSFIKEDDEWKYVDTKEKVSKDYMINSIVRGIVTAEYEEIDPIHKGDKNYSSTGIDNPEYIVTFSFKDNKPDIIVKLTEKDEKTGKLYITPDNGKTAYYISGYFISNFPEKKEDLMD